MWNCITPHHSTWHHTRHTTSHFTPQATQLKLQQENMPILQHIAFLNTKRIILASQSPRRKAILNQLGLTTFTIRPSETEETNPLDKSDNKFLNREAEFAIETARHKAVDVWNSSTEEHPDLVVAADTVVVSEEKEILGKPKSHQDAFEMLQKLQGTTMSVVTGCALCYKTKEDTTFQEFATHTFSVAATVHFQELTDAEIMAYVATGEPMGKAGSYGIQGIGGALIKGIEGDYYSVMGFPLNRFCQEMKKIVLPEWL